MFVSISIRVIIKDHSEQKNASKLVTSMFHLSTMPVAGNICLREGFKEDLTFTKDDVVVAISVHCQGEFVES